MNEGQNYDYDKRNISVVICDTNIHNGHGDICKTVEVVTST
jgi:hypothetical protein